MKKIAAIIIVGLVLPFTFAACGTQQDEYVGVCVDPNTEQRLEDDACESGDDDFLTYAVLWYMLSSSSHPYPAVGGKVTKSYFKTTLPKGAKSHLGLPKTGGTSVKSYSSTTTWGKPKTSSGGSGTSTKPKSYTYKRR